MKKIKEWLVAIGVIVVFLAVAAFGHLGVKEQPELPGQIEQIRAESQQLQDDIQQLRAELEDVRNVQGYMAWETDWRNRRDAP